MLAVRLARGSLKQRDVKIPGILVNCVVVAEKAKHHWQTFATSYSSAYSSEIRAPMSSIPKMAMSERKIIARRAAMERKANRVVNLGIGMPEVLRQRCLGGDDHRSDNLTVETCVLGAVFAGGLNFGAATNAQAIIDQPYQFDFYDGGGFDVAFLGLAQADR